MIQTMTRNATFVLILSAAVWAAPVNARQLRIHATARDLPVASDPHPALLSAQRKGHDLSTPIGHELWLQLIDNAAVAVRDTKGSALIAIARLGKGERDRRLSRLRLKYVAEILAGRGFPFQLVVAEGEAVPELGRVEFYVCNELFTVLPYERGKAVAIQPRP
jgi:hypothetical protein